ncbi:hypothetical protein [Devosia chinhatensis]|uniref:hypothetical protein n=1 Tax=Devosia chinhatensis TaxID=429727 RepID=UPI001364AB11|nr:hypothetical protein [Devosia chinhatensis]
MRLIICEDEFLLAVELAEHLLALGATVVASAASLKELGEVLDQHSDVNAAILDVVLADGEIYDVVPTLEQMGLALLFYSAHQPSDCPVEFAHIPWRDKLDPPHKIATTLLSALDARRTDHN